MKTSHEKNSAYQPGIQIAEADLAAAMLNNRGIAYAIDRNFRYISLNSAFKKLLKDAFGVHAKPGDRIFRFPVNDKGDEAKKWNNCYEKALKGEHLKFVTECKFGGKTELWYFDINPIQEKRVVSGATCVAFNINEIYKTEPALKESKK